MVCDKFVCVCDREAAEREEDEEEQEEEERDTESKTRTPHKDVGKIAKAQNTQDQGGKKIPK